MARTLDKWLRVYIDGLDMSGYTRGLGPLVVTRNPVDIRVVNESVIGVLTNHLSTSPGTYNGIFDTTAGGLHASFAGGEGTIRTLMAAIGEEAEPALGVPVYGGQFIQGEYQTSVDGGAVVATMPFPAWSILADTMLYGNPWSRLLHPKGAEAAVNSAVGYDGGVGGATAFGGYMLYQLFSSNGTVNLKTQDAAVNTDPSFADLVATGLFDASASPLFGIVPLSTTATVREFLRWQLVFGTATMATFALSFHRRRS